MAQRLVFTADGDTTIQELNAFIKAASSYGIAESASISVTHDGDETRLSIAIPNIGQEVAARKVKPMTPKQERVKKQIENHRAKKARGEVEAYVPPEGRTTPSKVKKSKCPVCNIKKPLTKVGKITVVKPHLSKGENCAGSGNEPALVKKVGVVKGDDE